MACQDLPRTTANAIPFAVQLGGSHLPAMHALPRREKSLSRALEIAAHPASTARNFGNHIHCSSA
jgi:hypothetical protein